MLPSEMNASAARGNSDPLGSAAAQAAGSDPLSRADMQPITVSAGQTWATLCTELAASGQRPLILPEDLDATIAETLRLDDFGDSSHLRGTIRESVQAIPGGTDDGAQQTIERSDASFLSRLEQLARTPGSEQLRLDVIRRPQRLLLRRCAWTSVPEFIRDVLIDAAIYQHEFLRARLFFGSQKCVVRALLGSYAPSLDISFLRPVTATEAEAVDLSQDPSRPKWPSGPWLSFCMPLPDGLRAWPELGLRLEEQGLINSLARGASSIAVLPRPLPGHAASRWHFRLVLRPEVRSSEHDSLLPRLRLIAEQASALGATLRPTGTCSDPAFADLPGTIAQSLR